MTDNLYCTDIYNQLKAILSGCDTISDALPFCNAYATKYPEHRSMIFSYTNGCMYRDTIDIRTKQSILYDVLASPSRNNAIDIISRITDKTHDDIYMKTLDRIANKKHYIKTEKKSVSILPNISKKCPHCSHVINMPENTDYIICGYQNAVNGYDWNGCGREWCFRCDKILCKKWELDSLHLHINRQHDDTCCLTHAKKNNKIYPDDYCQCNIINVSRNNNVLNFF